MDAELIAGFIFGHVLLFLFTFAFIGVARNLIELIKGMFK
jgi:hypothetical protein